MEPIARTVGTVDWITGIVFLSLVFLTIAKGIFYPRFVSYIVLPFDNRYISLYNKKDKLMNWFHLLIISFMGLNFALFIYLGRHILFNSSGDAYPFMFIIILGAVLVFLFLKVSFQMLNGFIFNSSREMSEIIFKKLSYFGYSGIVMFLANVLLNYVFRDSLIVFYTAILLVFLINASGWATVVRQHQKFIAHHFFYFILYLCALEIAPLVIIGNYLNY